MKRLKKLLIALTSIFSVISLFPLSACSGGAMHTLTMINENEDGGTLSGEGTYKTGSQVTVSYNANKGYKFDHWDIDGETIKISSKAYTFKMPDKDITVKGNFVAKTYELDVNLGYYGAGEVTGSGKYAYNSEVTVACTVNTGFTFTGWYSNTDKKYVSNDTTYTFKMPAKDYELTATYEKTKYNISVIVSNPNVVSAYISQNVDYLFYREEWAVSYSINNNIDGHYSFTGLYEYVNGQKGSLISTDIYFTMPDHDLVIYLEVTKDYKFSHSGGNVTEYSTYHFEGEEITITKYDTMLGSFLGWYDEKDNLISTDSSYSFTMPTHDVYVIGKYEMFGNYIPLGEYPQTIVTDSETINELKKITETNSKGYIEYQGNQYLYINKIQEPGRQYYDLYFKVEPIKWMKFKTSNPKIAGLTSLMCIDYCNVMETDLENGYFNYSNSETRRYLNNDFISKAFTSEEQKQLLEVSVDGSSSKVIVDKSTYDSPYFTDKVFVPGIGDYGTNIPTALFDGDIYNYNIKFGLYSSYVGYHSNKCVSYVTNVTISCCHYLARDINSVQYYYQHDAKVYERKLNAAGTVLELRPIIYISED